MSHGVAGSRGRRSRLLLDLPLLLEFLDLRLVHRALRRVRGHGALAFHHGFDDGLWGEVLDDLPGVHAQRAQGCEARLKVAVVDALRMQLFLNPLVDADRGHALSLARPRSEREPLQRVQRALRFGHGARGRSLFVFPLAAGGAERQGGSQRKSGGRNGGSAQADVPHRRSGGPRVQYEGTLTRKKSCRPATRDGRCNCE